MTVLLLAPLFLPPPEYFRKMESADLVVLDTSMRYDKQFKAVHRTVLFTPLGNKFLTVPVSTPEGSKCHWEDVRVSGHGGWWHVQRDTMATLFGKTPFFDLYRRDIFEYFTEQAVGRRITDLDIDLIVCLRRLLGIATPMSVTLDSRFEKDSDVEIVDMRRHDFYENGDISALDALFHNGRILDEASQ